MGAVSPSEVMLCKDLPLPMSHASAQGPWPEMKGTGPPEG
jgi:hypothetical protein